MRGREVGGERRELGETRWTLDPILCARGNVCSSSGSPPGLHIPGPPSPLPTHVPQYAFSWPLALTDS